MEARISTNLLSSQKLYTTISNRPPGNDTVVRKTQQEVRGIISTLTTNIDILEKAAPLTAEERTKIEMHPLYGAEIIKGIKFLSAASDITLYHHEKYDGKGYPYGLK